MRKTFRRGMQSLIGGGGLGGGVRCWRLGGDYHWFFAVVSHAFGISECRVGGGGIGRYLGVPFIVPPMTNSWLAATKDSLVFGWLGSGPYLLFSEAGFCLYADLDELSRPGRFLLIEISAFMVHVVL